MTTPRCRRDGRWMSQEQFIQLMEMIRKENNREIDAILRGRRVVKETTVNDTSNHVKLTQGG